MYLSSSSERDPRIDPQAGDSLRRGEIEWRVIGYISFLERIEVMEFKGGQFLKSRWPVPSFFRQWAEDATEVNRSEDLSSDLLALDQATQSLRVQMG